MATTIVSTEWTLISGPGSCDIVTPDNLNTSVSGFTDPGDYIFRLTVTDNLSQVNTAECTVNVAANFTVDINNSIGSAGISSVTGIADLTFTDGDDIPFSGSGTYFGLHTAFSGTITVNTSGTIPAFPIGVFHARLKINGAPFGTVYPATSGGSYSWTITVGDTDLIEFDLST